MDFLLMLFVEIREGNLGNNPRLEQVKSVSKSENPFCPIAVRQGDLI